MTRNELKEAAVVARVLLKALGECRKGRHIEAAASLRSAVGALDAAAETWIDTGDIAVLDRAFDLANAAGATYSALARIQAAAEAISPVGKAAAAIVSLFIVLSLASRSQLIGKMDFSSRDDVDRYLAEINQAYSEATDFAAGLRESSAYVALVSLHAGTVRDLTNRSRPLPKMVTFAFPRRLPALAMANRIYGDGERYLELIEENRPIHPLFMAESGRALAR